MALSGSFLGNSGRAIALHYTPLNIINVPSARLGQRYPDPIDYFFTGLKVLSPNPTYAADKISGDGPI